MTDRSFLEEGNSSKNERLFFPPKCSPIHKGRRYPKLCHIWTICPHSTEKKSRTRLVDEGHPLCIWGKTDRESWDWIKQMITLYCFTLHLKCMLPKKTLKILAEAYTESVLKCPLKWKPSLMVLRKTKYSKVPDTFHRHRYFVSSFSVYFSTERAD